LSFDVDKLFEHCKKPIVGSSRNQTK